MSPGCRCLKHRAYRVWQPESPTACYGAGIGEMSKPRAHRLNVQGDFYVTDDCCTACGVPEANAPELFAYDPNGHCYVVRQPATSPEMDRMITAMAQQELGCIRYRGSDDPIVARLRSLGEGAQVDSTSTRHDICRQASRSRLEPVLSWIGKVVSRLTQR
jgi:ferredoxin